jgi:hypothetical protein
MSRPAMFWIGLILFLAAGCVRDAYLAQPPSAPRYTRVLKGTPTRVASGLEVGFGSIDMPILRKRDQKEIRLVGTSNSGRPFCVHVRAGTAGSAATTVVSVQWDGEPDEQLWKAIEGWLAACVPPKDNPPKGT